VTTSLLVDDQLVHVGYAEERDDLFVMALPAHKAGLEKTQFFLYKKPVQWVFLYICPEVRVLGAFFLFQIEKFS
jgi:hypothetical protein